MAHILIAEDDERIAMLEKDYLEINDFTVTIASDGDEAMERILAGGFDLLILDVMMPGKNGYDICREVRDQIDIPILMVTAKQESIDKIRGLGLGADDYIVKPFDPAELVARVKAHLARYQRLKGGAVENGAERAHDAEDFCIEVGGLRILAKSWKVIKNGQEIHFPNREFELLKYLAMNPNIVFSKEHLFEKIWGYDYVGDSATVTVHIN